MGLGVFDIDLGVEFQLYVIGGLFGVGMAGEGEAGGLQIDVDFGDIRRGDCQIDVVLLCVG